MYGFDKDHIPYPYEPIDWQMRRERVPNDFGQPKRVDAAEWDGFEDLERNQDYMLTHINSW